MDKETTWGNHEENDGEVDKVTDKENDYFKEPAQDNEVGLRKEAVLALNVSVNSTTTCSRTYGFARHANTRGVLTGVAMVATRSRAMNVTMQLSRRGSDQGCCLALNVV